MTALVYQGQAICRQGEMLSLTDMWRAAEAPSGKRPANWARKEGADFISFVASTLGVPKEHVYRAERGTGTGAYDVPHGHIKGGRGGGDTWGHWQVAIAYAKYLSHAFHAWCNEVVRAHMEGLQAPPMPSVEESNLRAEEHKLNLVAWMQAMKGPAYAFALYRRLGLPVAEPEPRELGSETAAESAFAADLLAVALEALAHAEGPWTGTPSQLYLRLCQLAPRETLADRRWPRDPQALGWPCAG